MSTPVFATFIFESLLIGLIWAVWVVLNLWIWQKSKASGNLLMMVGAAVMALASIIGAFGEPFGGFYLPVKPMVAAHLAALQAKVKGIGKGSGTPPAAGGGAPPAQ